MRDKKNIFSALIDNLSESGAGKKGALIAFCHSSTACYFRFIKNDFYSNYYCAWLLYRGKIFFE